MSRVLSHAERVGIRYLARSPQFGPFRAKVVSTSHGQSYVFALQTVKWSWIRQAARDSREAPNMWRCCWCNRLMPYFLRRCKGCKGAGNG